MAEIIKAEQAATGPKDLANDELVFIGGYDAAGRAIEYKIAPPTSSNFAEWPLMVQVAMLKMGTFKNSAIPEIIYAVAYANRCGLDVMQGDVYPTGSGRLGISNKAKIKLALATGNIVGMKATIRDTGSAINVAGCSLKTDLECTATISVRGWSEPIVKTQRLSKWFMAKNPNWVSRPEYMLELNTLAHACEFVAPGATGDDEAPPLTLPLNQVTVGYQPGLEPKGVLAIATPSNSSAVAVEAQFVQSKENS